MATVRGDKSDMSDMEPSVAPKTTRAKLSAPKARAARAPRVAADMVAMDAASLNEPAVDALALGSPERKYSFNTLLAAGIIGFVVGRICAR